MEIQEILNGKDEKLKKSLFLFSRENTKEEVLFKFNIWSRYFFPKYFTSPDAEFHPEIDTNNLKAYWGELTAFIDIAFRGAAKTARTKLFMAFAIANDEDHFRKYIKVLSADGDNSTQIVTDIYNMLTRTAHMYPELFEKTQEKREEKMSSFTTTTGVKIKAGTVGTDQRGAIQEDARQDFIWYEDFENRTTLRSARKTLAISENMEEARTGLAVNGSCLYTCNYISEAGIVHMLVTAKKNPKKKLLIIPIKEDGKSAWPERYSLGDIDQMEIDDDDFHGERMCKPSAGPDAFFDRESVEKQKSIEPIKESAGLKIFREFDPSHRIASGHDVAGGVGLDSSTSVFIDFEVNPAQVIATFANNTIKPDIFGDEVNRQSDIFGGCLAGIEQNNHGHTTIARAKQLEVNMYFKEDKETKINGITPKEYGWHTNGLTKPKMLFALAKAVKDGVLQLNDKALIAECKSYTRNDLIDDQKDPRLTTRHFDLLIATAIAWQMKDHATYVEEEEPLEVQSTNFK